MILKTHFLLAVFIISLLGSAASVARLANHDESSFALQYRELRILLQNVRDRKSAISNKAAIEDQINILKQNQIAGEVTFRSMTESEQSLFIKKFQRNRFHCGEVTQVMEERHRILLQPEMAEILRDLLQEIP